MSMATDGASPLKHHPACQHISDENGVEMKELERKVNKENLENRHAEIIKEVQL